MSSKARKRVNAACRARTNAGAPRRTMLPRLLRDIPGVLERPSRFVSLRTREDVEAAMKWLDSQEAK